MAQYQWHESQIYSCKPLVVIISAVVVVVIIIIIMSDWIAWFFQTSSLVYVEYFKKAPSHCNCVFMV